MDSYTGRYVGYCVDNSVSVYFIPKCPVCGRFVKADETIKVNIDSGPKDEPNATCKRDGRVKMYFEGWF